MINIRAPLRKAYVGDAPLVVPGDLGIVRQGTALLLARGHSTEVVFRGAERQPQAGQRYLAYIPMGETPTEAHFLVAGKSVSSMTGRLPLAGISGTIDHHLAFWYADTLPEFDIFVGSNTLNNFHTAFGLPNPLSINGVDGFYHVTENVTRHGIPSTFTSAFYAESRTGVIIRLIYSAWTLNPTITAADFLSSRFGNVFAGNIIRFKEIDIPKQYVTATQDLTALTEDSFIVDGLPLGALYTDFRRVIRDQEMRIVVGSGSHNDQFRIVVASHSELGDITGMAQSTSFPDTSPDPTTFAEDNSINVTIGGETYRFWVSESLDRRDADNDLYISQAIPNSVDYRRVGVAVPLAGPDIDSIRFAGRFDKASYIVNINGEDYKVYEGLIFGAGIPPERQFTVVFGAPSI